MPLQKSFSDQNHSAIAKQKNRAQWNKNKSFSGPQTSKSNPSSGPLREKAPVLVSTATKNKLNGFQFDAQAKQGKSEKAIVNLVSDDEKENEVSVVEKAVSKSRHKKSSQEQPVLPLLRNDIPTTPAGKLALMDLVGMGDVRRTAIQSISPDERIEWDNEMNSSDGGIRTKKRKRARSSSPMCSPATASAQFKAKTETMNPQLDPGSEIWGRYSLNGSTATIPQAQVPHLAHIMQTSSPQPPKGSATPRSTSTLRRANSCGNQFPKRRRVGGQENRDMFTEPMNIGPSKLSVLLERVQEGLSQPKPRTRSRPSNLSSPEEILHEEDEVMVEAAPEALETTKSEFSDDEFGDDELDATLLEDIVVDPISAPPESRTTETPIPVPPLQQPSQQRNTFQQSFSRTENTEAKEEHDEFDDSDDDIFSAGLEQIASQFDHRSEHSKSRTPAKIGGAIQPQKSRISIVDSEDEFGDDGLDDLDFEEAEASATQSLQQTANSLIPSTQKARAIQRYLVTEILESDFQNAKGRKQREKILLLQVEHKKTLKTVHLRGVWIESPVTVKAYVHVIGIFDFHGSCVIDDERGILILHPDHLISSTVVADSFGCTRRAVLQDRIKSTSEASPPLVYGTILHEIFQAAMLANRWDTEWLSDLIERIAINHLELLYTIKLQVEHAVQYLQTKMGELQSWAELFVSSLPKNQALVQAGNGEKASMCVSKLLDVEEHVWSPMYGLKGNIDATVQVTMNDSGKHRTLTVPFEVKTGKNPSAAHRAQTALYNLLLSDRYDIEIAYGILYYMETSETIRIPTIRHELRHMIMQRNELACFVRERDAQLPPMLKKENMCNRCYAKVPCFIYHRLADDGTGETSGLQSKFDDVVKHLTPKHKEFFLKWDDLLTKEEKESLKFRRELWTMLSSEREKLGRCFSDLIIEPGSAYEEVNQPKINRYQYSLVKPEPPIGFSFLESQIVIGEPIVISDEDGHFALANGFVTHVRKKRITVAVDRRLHNARIRQPGFDEVDNQVFASIMEVAQEGSTDKQAEGKIWEEPVRYRLDKDEFSNGLATVRNNLIQVMADGPFGSRQIRGLVVDLNAPRFKQQATAYTLKDRESINVDQRRAIQKVMSAEDYALVLGMPGTGKTTTIAHIIRALVSQGKSVLLTSYTHTAVDNILLKLKDDGIPILRIGTPSKISPEVREFATLAATKRDSFEEIRHAWHDTPIVATTCLGINHAIFNERTFDYCIVDEASQIMLPVCLGPIRLARTFILVGDHNQLPPLVQNAEARTGGLDISLFKHLSDMHPNSVVYLEHQYRMCSDVMALSNNLIYNGRLKCGSQEVANKIITIPNIDALRNHHYSPSTLSRSQRTICPGPNHSSCWLNTLISPSTKVSFINTDPLLPLSREQAKGNRIVNPTEAILVTQLVESLLTTGVPESSIGVMTHYRSQLALLKHNLRSHPGVEMHTADRFQGRDKEVIILSLVRSNDARSIGELLKDWRRINVAFTRAKTKLLVIGSRETLKGNGKNEDGKEEMVARFVKLMEEKDWVFDLPRGALEDHLFEGNVTQTQASVSVVNASIKTEEKKRKIDQREGFIDLGIDDDTEKENTGRKVLGEREKGNVGMKSPKEVKKGIQPLGNRMGNGNIGKRVPKKTITGLPPYKPPRQMGALDAVISEALG